MQFVLSGVKGKLSRELIASWADEYAPALALLRHIFPPGLMRFLNTPKAPAAQPTQAMPPPALAPAPAVAMPGVVYGGAQLGQLQQHQQRQQQQAVGTAHGAASFPGEEVMGWGHVYNSGQGPFFRN